MHGNSDPRQQAKSEPLLAPLLETPEELRAAYRRRRDEFDYQKIHPADEAKYVTQGWEPHRLLQSALWIKKTKTPDRRLEDRVWSLFYRMGYPVLSGGSFRMRYRRPDGSIGNKQVDVFAKDTETAIVVECKAREALGRRPLQKDIHETENLQRHFSQSIRSHFGGGFNPKIIWIYATNNIVWNEKDIERAEAAHIRIITENELQYFEAFIGHIGDAGRYQFLAEFLEGQEIPGLSNVRVPAAKGSFGRHTYYSFAISARHLLKIAFVNHQALNHPDGRPAYQRMINKNRISQIGMFIQNGGFFPTNILVNFTETCRFDLLPNKHNADKNTKFGWLYLPNKYKSAWMIDGQHRLYGFSNIADKFLDNTLFVLAFEKMDTQTEAELFITINHEQRSVSKSLLVALQADLKLGSGDPKEALGALASALVRSMSTDSSSPFFRRFETPGITPSDTQNLTIAEAVKGLVRSNLLGRTVGKKTKAPGFLSGQTDNETLARARKFLNGYFRSIMDANPTRWQNGRTAYICVNPGIRAHFQLIQEVLQHLYSRGLIDPFTSSPERLITAAVDFIEPLRTFFGTASDRQIEERFSRKFGEGGVVEYFYNMCDIIGRKQKEFGSDEFKKFKSQQADARLEQTERDINDLQNSVAAVVVESLKKIHGTHELPSGEKAYWDLGIENLDIEQSAYKKQQSAPVQKRAPKEAYLDLIDFDKIVRQGSNWPSFEPIFNIPMDGEQKGKKYYLQWLERLNEVRRTAAHKSPYRTFSEEDFEFVSWIKRQLYDKFSAAGFDPALF
jgi:DNA sulfur modification protein DndB